ncbi:MAG: AprI/Inh family metalloprotease inhibitor, partial [Pseudomonadota bacterium]
MRGPSVLCLGALLAAIVALPAAALDAPKDYAGKWTLSGLSEGADVCTVDLGDEGAIGGWTIKVPKDCVQKFGVSTDIAAWTVYPDGAIGFIDPMRKLLLKFEPSQIGGYVATPDEGEGLSLDRVTPGGDKPLTEQQRMSGKWALGEMGDRLCTWTSTPDAAGMKGTLKPLAPCQPAWAAKGIVGWRRAGGKLLLVDKA